MRAWTRVDRDQFCGRCNALIAKGAAVQTIQLTQLSRILVRCETCAEGLAPPDLPALVERRPAEVLPFTSTRTLANSVPRDWAKAAAGDLE